MLMPDILQRGLQGETRPAVKHLGMSNAVWVVGEGHRLNERKHGCLKNTTQKNISIS
jgi:hypothetical protein